MCSERLGSGLHSMLLSLRCSLSLFYVLSEIGSWLISLSSYLCPVPFPSSLHLPSTPSPSFRPPSHLPPWPQVTGASAADSAKDLRQRGGGVAWRAAECEGGEQPSAAALGSKPPAASRGPNRSQSAARDHPPHQREPGTLQHTCQYTQLVVT